jgi:hypothetical protein
LVWVGACAGVYLPVRFAGTIPRTFSFNICCEFPGKWQKLYLNTVTAMVDAVSLIFCWFVNRYLQMGAWAGVNRFIPRRV